MLENSHFFRRLRVGFTLAEVLITLGVIGVVAALSIPQLITAYQKTYVESHVKHFYATLNNAVRLSAEENGHPTDWVKRNKTYSYAENLKFLQTYIYPYYRHGSYWEYKTSSGQKYIATEVISGGVMYFSVDANGLDIMYFPFATKDNKGKTSPRTYFGFQFSKYASSTNKKSVNSPDMIEPYIFNWKGTEADLRNNSTWGCRKGCTNCSYCTKLLQLKGWKITKDYPW